MTYEEAEEYVICDHKCKTCFYDIDNFCLLVVQKKHSSNLKAVVTDENILVNKILNGDFGNGLERKKNLERLGIDYNRAQTLVNERIKKDGKKINVLRRIVAKIFNM